MSEINWGMINSGGAFESLMHALVFAEDSTALLFGRPGKDSGQDARSLDGTRVYQAKFYSGLKMDKAVELALAELENIKTYKNPTHANYKHWKFAKHWTLVANITINPNDSEKWHEVVQAFQQEGFQTVDYWGLESLEQKLIQHPEIRDAFFEGDNRTMIGLREANEWLSLTSPGRSFIDAEYIGHSDLFDKVQGFSTSNKRLLSVQGDHCSGISRFLYEVMNKLSDAGKRVYWGLSKEMSRSSAWFKYLQSSKETYVIIDDVDSRDLVKRILEQMLPIEYSNWKVIIASHTENVDTVLQPIRMLDQRLIESIELLPLGKNDISLLARKCIQGKQSLPSAEVLYTYTQGLPGWLMMLMEASVRYGSSKFVITDDFSSVVSKVTAECLMSIPDFQRTAAQKVLRWIAVWDVLQIDEQSFEIPEFEFLRNELGNVCDVSVLLHALVDTGIVHNWGIGKRCFAVDPYVVRQELLRDWLLQKNGDNYAVSSEGRSFVARMVKGAIPHADSALKSLSNMAMTYMGRIQTETLLNPLFDVFIEESQNGSILDQSSIIQLLQNVGWAHPDRTLEVLNSIRNNPKESQIVHNDFFGDVSIDSEDVMSDIAEDIFQYGRYATSMTVASRYLNEIKELFELEGNGNLVFHHGGSCESKLLKLLTSEAEKHYIACDTVANVDIKELSSSKFAKAIAKALLNPEREVDVWTRYSLTISWNVVRPNSSRWKYMLELRKKLFTRLLDKDCSDDRILFWNLLSESHHAFFHAIFSNNGFPDDLRKDYRELLNRDLRRILCVSRKHGRFSLEEFTAAREMWSWYLQYGQPEHPVELARRCENIDYENSDWGMQNFFAFRASQDVTSAIDRVERKLKSCSTIAEWKSFFNHAKRYLRIARGDKKDLADNMRIADLALRFTDSFNPLEGEGIIKEFVKSILSEINENPLEMCFAIQLCKHSIKAAKTLDDHHLLESTINELLKWTGDRARFLWLIYADSSPLSIGELTKFEQNIVNENTKGLPLYETAVLQAQFVGIGRDVVLANMAKILKDLDNVKEASRCMSWFISSLLTSFIRYEYDARLIPISWIFSQINNLDLDGAILGQYDAEDLARRSCDRQGMIIALDFFKRRFMLEGQKPYAEYQILPYEFNATNWFYIDNQDAFDNLCVFVVQHYSILSIYKLPKCLSDLDSSAICLSRFVSTYLENHSDLTPDELYVLAGLISECKSETEGWRESVSVICRYCEKFTVKERYYVYAGFQRKNKIGWLQAGIVPQDLINAVDNAQKLFDNEKDSHLIEYRQWVLCGAKKELEKAQERVEEELHHGA